MRIVGRHFFAFAAALAATVLVSVARGEDAPSVPGKVGQQFLSKKETPNAVGEVVQEVTSAKEAPNAVGEVVQEVASTKDAPNAVGEVVQEVPSTKEGSKFDVEAPQEPTSAPEEYSFDADDVMEIEDIDWPPLTSEQLRAMHKKVDEDNNGKISLPEFVLFAQKRTKAQAVKESVSLISEMDTNKDGKLSLEEFLKDMESFGVEAFNEEGHEVSEPDSESAKIQKSEAAILRAAEIDIERQKFKAVDADGDGLLGEEALFLFYPEFHSGVLEIAAQVALKNKDVNGDGKLTLREFWSVEGLDEKTVYITEEQTENFNNLDTNKDGFINVEESKAWESGQMQTEDTMKDLFGIADTNKDGFLTFDELDAAHENIDGIAAHYHFKAWVEAIEKGEL